MYIDPSQIIYFEWGIVRISATVLFTWLVMIILTLGSYIMTKNINSDNLSKSQNILEALLDMINNQIKEISQKEPGKYLAFIGTLFIFIFTSNVLSIVPGFRSPTGSINTSIALAISVFLAVPFYGISENGLKKYLKQYIKPTVLMLP